MKVERIRKLNDLEVNSSGKSVLYWMDRQRRFEDNWALYAAFKKAEELNVCLEILYVIPDKFMDANLRTYDFMLKGLQETAEMAYSRGINLKVVVGDVVDEVLNFCKQKQVAAVYTDFVALKLPRKWRNQLAKKLDCAFFEIENNSIIPTYILSEKQEFAAYTIRPKVKRLFHGYLDDLDECNKVKNPVEVKMQKIFDVQEILQKIPCDKSIEPQSLFLPGSRAAKKVLKHFFDKKIVDYSELRNDPNEDVLSNLSMYLHFGFICVQRVILDLFKQGLPEEIVETFVEEIVVRRQLAENFCFYNSKYDEFDGMPEWAKKTLLEHWDDKREVVYSLKEFEEAKTHDELWNAAQMQMVQTGKMHGYMRMYWAKKILEWSKDPSQALKIANFLNNKYELDGRDPGGYTGVAWSICGVHDRAWGERDVFGKVRFMNFNGCKRKFDVKKYIETWNSKKQSLL